MAYSFNGTNQYLSASAAVTAAPLTMFARMKRPTATVRYFLCLSKADVDNQMFLNYTGGGTNNEFFVQSGAFFNAVGLGGLGTNRWDSFGGTTASSTSRYAFVNDVRSSQGTTNLTPSGINTLAVATGILNNTATLPTNGDFADVALWNAELTLDEINSLSKGFSPKKIRPQNLQFYAPLIRDLQDVRGGLTITNNNAATVSDHPRVYA